MTSSKEPPQSKWREDVFKVARMRTPAAEAKLREHEMIKRMAQLQKINDEATFKQALKTEFGILEGHPRYELIMRAWRGDD